MKLEITKAQLGAIMEVRDLIYNINELESIVVAQGYDKHKKRIVRLLDNLLVKNQYKY